MDQDKTEARRTMLFHLRSLEDEMFDLSRNLTSGRWPDLCKWLRSENCMIHLSNFNPFGVLECKLSWRKHGV